MCEVADFTGNKTLVCTVGDLQPGQRYRDPEGNEYLIAEGDLIVNVATGAVTCRLDWVEAEGRYRKDTKLGTDRAGRLYASRSLNQVYPGCDPDRRCVHGNKWGGPCDHCDGHNNSI